MRTQSGRIGTLLGAATLALLAACNGKDVTAVPAPKVAARLATVTGDSASVQVGTSAADPIAIKVLDENGDALPGVAVAWTIVQGDGALSAPSTVTDAHGIATVSFTPAGAGTDIVAASVANLATMDEITVFAAPATLPADSTVTSDSTAASGN